MAKMEDDWNADTLEEPSWALSVLMPKDLTQPEKNPSQFITKQKLLAV